MSSHFDAAAEKRLTSFLRSVIPDLQAIYLFGSATGSEWHPDSDVDIGVLASQPLSELQRYDIAQSLASELGHDVDLIDLKTASAVLKVQIIAGGKRLYGLSDFDISEFEDFAFSDYARLNEERAGILADIARRGSVYGG